MWAWLLLLLPLAACQNCPTQASTVSCTSSTIFLLDVSDKLSLNDVNEILNYAYDIVLPKLALAQGQEVAFLTYGSVTPVYPPMTSIYNLACSQLYNLLSNTSSNSLRSASLGDALLAVAANYDSFIQPELTVQIFSSTTNAQEIAYAVRVFNQTMSGVDATIVSLSGRKDVWQSFPHKNLIAVKPWELESNSLTTDCLLKTTCGGEKACSRLPEHAALTTPKTVVKTTPRNSQTSRCECNYGTIWNDVFILIDGSINTGSLRQIDLWNTVRSRFASLNVEADSNNRTVYRTRVGIATYGNNYYLVRHLGEVSNYYLQNFTSLEYNGDSSVYLSTAFQRAKSELSRYGRPNARQVIIVVASDSSGTSDASYTSTEFVNYGGVLIVYRFRGPGDKQGYLLNLPSGSIRIDSDEDDGFALQNALCDANCKCTRSYTEHRIDQYHPIDACYLPIQNATSLQVANNYCSAVRNGFVATLKTQEQTNFTRQLYAEYFQYVPNLMEGMKWDSFFQGYMWNDGTPVNGTFQPWYGGKAQHVNGQDCVYVMSGSKTDVFYWVGTDCRNHFPYVCQSLPCDSTHYCAT